ncbi:hypothetical protein HK102_005361 [Quaeritorhiza haematococci]|nr:hypothetical protein HK102_005361 [Quaeritorhiza haematococci]
MKALLLLLLGLATSVAAQQQTGTSAPSIPSIKIDFPQQCIAPCNNINLNTTFDTCLQRSLNELKTVLQGANAGNTTTLNDLFKPQATCACDTIKGLPQACSDCVVANIRNEQLSKNWPTIVTGCVNNDIGAVVNGFTSLATGLITGGTPNTRPPVKEAVSTPRYDASAMSPMPSVHMVTLVLVSMAFAVHIL